MRNIFTGPALLLASATLAMAGVSVDIPLDEVPAEIMSAARKAAPLATFTKANTETEADGTVVYEIGGTESEFSFDKLADNASEIDLSKLSDDGFHLQTTKVTLKNVPIEVDVLKDGKIEEIERVVPKELVPGMVMKRISRLYGDFEPAHIEASYNVNGKIFKYEFDGVFRGKDLDLEVSADGAKIIESDS